MASNVRHAFGPVGRRFNPTYEGASCPVQFPRRLYYPQVRGITRVTQMDLLGGRYIQLTSALLASFACFAGSPGLAPEFAPNDLDSGPFVAVRD